MLEGGDLETPQLGILTSNFILNTPQWKTSSVLGEQEMSAGGLVSSLVSWK